MGRAEASSKARDYFGDFGFAWTTRSIDIYKRFHTFYCVGLNRRGVLETLGRGGSFEQAFDRAIQQEIATTKHTAEQLGRLAFLHALIAERDRP